jgi:hypothetical protein
MGLFFKLLAEWTGLEPATPGVTGRYSNQLNYHSVLVSQESYNVPGVGAIRELAPRPRRGDSRICRTARAVRCLRDSKEQVGAGDQPIDRRTMRLGR